MSIIESESTLTDRYQTTVPEAVRRALHLGKRDRIRYAIEADGRVVLTRVESPVEDAALVAFLDFLTDDLVAHPERVSAIDQALLARLGELTEGVHVDLGAALPPDEA